VETLGQTTYVLTIVVATNIVEAVGRLRKEIKQTRPFVSLEEEAFLGLQRTADALMRGLVDVLKPAALSPTQYNILRILRGAGDDGLACREVGERMIAREPDMTRLLDRLEARKLVARERGRKDRRVITTRITAEGRELLKRLDAPVSEFPRRRMGHIGAERLRSLVRVLDQIRQQEQGG
jgi:DNA-binding MarR family transcriptional regulator